MSCHRLPKALQKLPGGLPARARGDRVKLIDAGYEGGVGAPSARRVSAPAAVLVRPDGYVAWVGHGTDEGLQDALTTWIGPPAKAELTARSLCPEFGGSGAIFGPRREPHPRDLGFFRSGRPPRSQM